VNLQKHALLKPYLVPKQASQPVEEGEIMERFLSALSLTHASNAVVVLMAGPGGVVEISGAEANLNVVRMTTATSCWTANVSATRRMLSPRGSNFSFPLVAGHRATDSFT
jgi:hypothetical protein